MILTYFDVINYHISFIVVYFFKACFSKSFFAWLLVGMEVWTAIAVANPASLFM